MEYHTNVEGILTLSERDIPDLLAALNWARDELSGGANPLVENNPNTALSHHTALDNLIKTLAPL